MFSEYNSSIIIQPPKKIAKSFYICDTKFYLDDILSMYNESINYGIVLLSGKEYRCYILEIIGNNKNFKLLASDTTKLQQHQKKGGQSAPRFEQNRMIERHHYTKKVSEVIKNCYMFNNNTKCIIKGLIVGGVGDIKKEIMEQPLFVQYFNNIVLKIVSTDTIDDQTIYNVYNKCLDVLENFDRNLVNSSINEIKELIAKCDDRLMFGINEVIEGLKNNMVKKVIVSESLAVNDQLKNYKNIIVVPDGLIDMYGNIVGIKYFVNKLDIFNEENE